MAIDDYTPEETQQLFRELREMDRKREQFRATSTPELADTIDQLARYLPQADAHLIEPLGQAVANGQMTLDDAQQVGLETQNIVLNDPQTYEEEDTTEGGFLSRFQDTVMDGVKAGSRWTFSAANFVPQVVTNLGARAVGATVGKDDEKGGVYEAPETGFFDGWFASTDLGSMMSGKDYGEGFFIGEDALEFQREQAKRYRGTVGDGGWTFGRGLASTFMQPGTKEYNILSGLVDAGAAIATPSIPFISQIGKGARVVKNAAAAQAGIKTRSLAGLAEFGNAQIITSKVPQWLDSYDGQNLQRHLIDNVNTWEDAIDTFGNKSISNEFIQRVIDIKAGDDLDDAQAVTQMRNLLEENLGLAGLGATTDIDMGATSKWFGTQSGNWRVGQVARRTRERLTTKVGDNTIYLDTSDDYARNDSVRKVLGVMRTLRLDDTISDATGKVGAYVRMDGTVASRNDLLQKIANATNMRSGVEFDDLVDEIDQMVAYGIGKNKRAGKKVIEQATARGEVIDLEDLANSHQAAAYALTRQFRTQQGENVLGSVSGEGGRANAFGLNPSKTQDAFDDVDEAASTIVPHNVGNQNALQLAEDSDVFAYAPLGTAGLQGEEAARYASIPDMTALRRETSKIAWMFTKRGKDAQIGDPNKFVTLLDFTQNRVWKSGTLMTGGYAIRNISESMVRSAMAPGIRTGPTHPIEWIMAMSKRRGFGTLDGVKWTEEALDAEAAKLMREYAEATGVTMREAVDQTALQYRAYQTGAWSTATAVTSANKFAQGVQDQVHLLATDPIVRQIAQGRTTPEIVDWMRTTDEGKAAVKSLQNRWKNKRPSNSDKRVTYDFVNDQGNLNQTNLEKVIDLYFRERLRVETGGDETLRGIIAKFGDESETDFNAFKLGEKDMRAAGGQRELLGYTKEFDDLVKTIVARHVDGADDFTLPEFVKYRVHSDGSGLTGAALQRHINQQNAFNGTVQHFFTNVFGKKEAFLNRSPAFRQFYYKQIENLLSRVDSTEAQKLVAKIQDAFVDEMSETYKTWKAVKPDADGLYRVGSETPLNKAAYDAKLAELKEAGLEDFSDQWARRYLGGGSIKDRITKDSLWDDIKARAAGDTQPAGAKLTAEELSMASKAYAMEETKKLFYNAAERSNFGDIMRIISPFGSAWAEVMKAWYQQVLLNPNRLKNMSVTFRGVRDMDPDGDGKAFIYPDPVTGEMMFNYPFVPGMSTAIFAAAGGLVSQTVLGRTPLGMAGSGALGLVGGGVAGATLGANAEQNGVMSQLSAPVKSANMALNVLPSVGPVVQIAANQILPDRPQFDDMRKYLMPFGTVEPTPGGLTEQITPSWAKKMIEAISADPEADRMFGAMYMDSYAALAASGQFDMNDPAQEAEVERRAKSSARSLLMLRSLGQFVGPARPGVVVDVPTKYEGTITMDDVKYVIEDGNVPANVLSKTFRMFQEEDYDTAVERFISTFGDNTMMYMIGKTTAIDRGLDASSEFGDWERENQDFIQQADNVYGYFAPVGSEFDMETYLRQLRTGARERRTDPEESYAEAESVVARMLYRKAVDLVGTAPSQEQQRALTLYKRTLQAEYPGYLFQPYNPTESASVINDLQKATSVAPEDNEIGKAAKVYFEYRDQAIAVANARRVERGDTGVLINPLTGKTNADLRAILRHVGSVLVTQHPEFGRMYDRELFREIDLDS